MSNDKNRDLENLGGGKDADYPSESSTRARNRTVMLTPEITGQVRARLAQELEGGSGSSGNDFGTPTGRNSEAPSSPRPGASFASLPSPGGDTGPQSFTTPVAKPVGGGYSDPTPIRESSSRAKPVSNQRMVWTKETPVVGFLVSFDANPNGEIFELRSGRLIVTSEPAAGGSYMVVEDSSVSPMHAILRISTTGEVQVLDQLSEFGTHIKRFGVEEEEHISGEKSSIEHGDIIKFGNRTFHVCILALES